MPEFKSSDQSSLSRNRLGRVGKATHQLQGELGEHFLGGFHPHVIRAETRVAKELFLDFVDFVLTKAGIRRDSGEI